MQGLIGPLKELAEFEELCKNKKKDVGMIRVCGCVNSQKSHMMYALGDGCKYKVIACSSETKAKQIYEEYRFLDSNTYLYPAKDFLFYQADIRSKELVKQRMEGIQAVLSGEPVTVVTSLDGFMDHLAPKESIAEKVLKIQNDSVLKLDEMAEKLSVIGYDREVQVEGPGQFAVRGGILDIYPLTEELPVRIELWGDEVDSIRTFDVESQRSIENLMDIVIYPAVEFPQNGEKGVSFLDYFPPEDTILFLDEPVRLVERGQNIEDEFMEAQKKRLESGYDLEEEEAKIFPVTEILKKINICFLFAQGYHKSMKNVAPVRKGMGERTIFNVLGPLSNPARATMQLLGVYDENLVMPMAQVLSNLGVTRGMVVCGGGMSLIGDNKVCEIRDGKLTPYQLDPEKYGLSLCTVDDLRGGSPRVNAQITRDILSGREQGAKREEILLNAGIALYLGLDGLTLEDGIKKAAELIDSGAALAKLDQFAAATQEAAKA